MSKLDWEPFLPRRKYPILSLTMEGILNINVQFQHILINRVERTAVSGKTSYLVAGFEMEDGRKITEGAQHKAAIKKKIKIISDRDLLNMVLEGLKKTEVEAETKAKEDENIK